MIEMDSKQLAIEIAELIDDHISLRDINDIGRHVFGVVQENFPPQGITKAKARSIHDWILTIQKYDLTEGEKTEYIVNFLENIVPTEYEQHLFAILSAAGIHVGHSGHSMDEFAMRYFHPEINKYCREAFVNAQYFKAVLNGCILFNNEVQEKIGSQQISQDLMIEAFSHDHGVLKFTPCQTKIDKSYQDGLMFIAAGMLQGVLDATQYDPPLEWPIDKSDCLDMLSLLSFLLRKFDNCTVYKG